MKKIILLAGCMFALTSCGKIDGGGGEKSKTQNFITVNSQDLFNDYVYLGIYKTSTYNTNLENFKRDCGDVWNTYTDDEKECFSNDLMYSSCEETWNIFYDVAKTGSYTININLNSSDKFGKYVANDGFINSLYNMKVFWLSSSSGDKGKLVNISTNSRTFKYTFEYDHKYKDGEETKTEHIKEAKDTFGPASKHTNVNVFKNGSSQIYNGEHDAKDISNLKITFTGVIDLSLTR